MSAVYAFENVARLKKGHKVLIQSATGGLGLAAIQIARSREAEIFATVSTPDQVSILADTVGIPAGHIFSSQDPETLSLAATATKKGGFDIILSTIVGGDSLYQSWRVLAPMGHYINVGRVDVLEPQGMGLELVQKNANFSSYELDVVLDNDPELGGELMKTVNGLYQTGQIAPIRPFSVSDVSELVQTLLGFSSGTHIGKPIVTFQNPDSIIKVLRQPQTATFDSKARYIITGGLGGLGRGIIRWMLDRGAHDFVVLSRRGASTSTAQVLLDDLKARGVRTEVIACDVSQWEQVVQVIEKISAAKRPVKGVVNAAMSLSHSSFDKLNIDQWRSGIAAKTQGVVNLHEATITLPLDFFVLLKSTETIWAPSTRAAYVAADNFAAYFARYRQRLGLPASAVSYGFISDAGSDSRESRHEKEDMYARNAASTMTQHQALAALEPAFLESKGPSQWIGQHQDPLSAATFFTCFNPIDLAGIFSTDDVPRWHRDGRVSLIMRAVNDARHYELTSIEDGIDGDADDSTSRTARLRHAFDDAIKTGPHARATTVELVTDGITEAVAEMLYIDVGNVYPSKSVAEHGVDSLVAAELRSWFRQTFDVNMQNLLDDQMSIQMLAGHIVDKALGGGQNECSRS